MKREVEEEHAIDHNFEIAHLDNGSNPSLEDPVSNAQEEEEAKEEEENEDVEEPKEEDEEAKETEEEETD